MKDKKKFLIPISILVLVYFIVTTTLIVDKYNENTFLDKLECKLNFVFEISDFIDSLQEERNLSFLWLKNSDIKYKKSLIKQRLMTDKIANLLNKKIKNEKDIKYNFNLKIDDLRVKIDNSTISIPNMIHKYAKIDNTFLHIIIKISKSSMILQNLVSYSDFLFAKERTQEMNLLGNYLLEKTYIEKKDMLEFKNLIITQKLYIDNFINYTSESIQKFYDNNTKDKSFEKLKNMQNIILNTQAKSKCNVDSIQWLNYVNINIEKLKIINEFFKKEILKNIDLKLDNARNSMIMYIIISIVNVFAFVLFVVLILQMIKNEQKLNKLINKYIIYSTTDLKGKILDVSDAFCSISGYNRNELIGKPHNIIRHKDMPKSAFKDMWNTIQQGKSWDGNVKNLKKDGGFYWVEAHISPTFNRKGNIESYTAIRVDITNSIALQDELKKNIKREKTVQNQGKLAQMGEMLSMIAHQWRQPLNAISASSINLSLLSSMNILKDSKIQEDTIFIQNQCQKMSETIETFMNFVKPSKESKEFELVHSFELIWSILSAQFKNKNIEVSLKENKKHIKIDGYEDLLEQVIINILSNARDAFDEIDIENKYIDIEMDEKEGIATIKIKDNAGGIPKDVVEKIFNPYFTTKEQGKGTGLGLYMSKDIMRKSFDGDLIYSATNDGSLFEIRCGGGYYLNDNIQ